jgi:hypothetical protein
MTYLPEKMRGDGIGYSNAAKARRSQNFPMVKAAQRLEPRGVIG